MTGSSKAARGKKPVRKKAPRAPKAPTSATAEFERLLLESSHNQRYVLRLYITGSSPRSTQAIANIRSLCEEHLAGRYDLDVIDIYQQPDQAMDQQIIAAPTLIKRLPFPAKRMVGDLSNRDRVLVGLDLDDAKTTWMKV